MSPRPLAWVLACSLLAATAFGQGHGTPDGPVQLPPRWHSGDTHVHTQPCGPGPLLDPGELVQQQLTAGVNIACASFWNPSKTLEGQQTYFTTLVPQIDGMLHVASRPSLGAILQFGVEVSGFNSSQFGHVCGIGITDGVFPNLEYPGADLEFFLAQPGAIAGYSHVRWPLGYQSMSGPQLAHLVPAMLPIDAALGAATFIEAYHFDAFDALDWRGIYYKLQNAGVRVALVAGTDNTCIYPLLGPIRTYVGTSDFTPDFDRWVDGVRAGCTSISTDGSVFLAIAVDKTVAGRTLHISGGAQVLPRVHVKKTPGGALSGTLELIYNGAVVATSAAALPVGGEQVWEPVFVPTESGWLAASLDGIAHTAAIYVIVDGQPIGSTADAQYLRQHCDQLVAPPPPFVVGASAAAIAERVTAARDIYDALALLEAPPVGVARYGVSTEACDGPIAIGLTGPAIAGQTIGVTCVHAPPGVFGVLAIGSDADQAAIDLLGASIYLDPLSPYNVDPVASNKGGYARRDYPLTPELVGQSLHMQFVWINPASCATAGLLSSSDALVATVQ
ncbi:MAG: hypothetical protein EPO68_07550 [Planctomycetota bacterium]|nr:MAG: hypothetical protein EPO68_07550 [Planctomycetota bacterium]